MKPDTARNIIQKSKNINGWFSVEAAMFFAWIDEIQRLNGITGDVFEIGCHHGKSTVLISAMVQPQGEKLCVCDLFGNQEVNISRSGRGDFEIFKRNMSLFNNGLNVQILQKNSNTLSVKEIGNNYRFFHIDGGHNCAEALSDLRLAADSIIEKGVIALDDPFRPEWPGVTEAVIRFLDENRQYCAIIVGFNKLILTRRDSSDIYSREMLKVENRQIYKLGYPWHLKELPFNGYPLQIFHIPTYLAKKTPVFYIRKYLQNHKWIKRFTMS